MSLTIWQQLCACPGGGQRQWQEDPDDPWPGAREYGEKSQRTQRERSAARREVFRVVRGAARGKGRDEVRDLYIAALRARGQDIPSGRFLEAELDVLTGHPLRGLRKLWSPPSDPPSS